MRKTSLIWCFKDSNSSVFVKSNADSKELRFVRENSLNNFEMIEIVSFGICHNKSDTLISGKYLNFWFFSKVNFFWKLGKCPIFQFLSVLSQWMILLFNKKDTVKNLFVYSESSLKAIKLNLFDNMQNHKLSLYLNRGNFLEYLSCLI
jgi:hypothetical protein